MEQRRLRQDMRLLAGAGLIVATTLVACGQKSDGSADKTAEKTESEARMTNETIDYRTIAFNTIGGEESSLAEFSGQALLVVNVASKCGYTPQYEGLQTLYEKYNAQGLTVIGFPANNYGEQEPGSNEEILQFCQTRFAVSFPMMAKVSVKGDDQHPLFTYLTENTDPTGDIPWNFHKFLLDREGNIVARFEPGIEPLSDELTGAIEKIL